MNNQKELYEIVSHFDIEGIVAAIEPMGAGFINDTLKVRTAGSSPDYILQRKNRNIFPDVPAMMENIVAVTGHIRRKVVEAGGDPAREVLNVVFTTDGLPYWRTPAGDYWTMCLFIDGSVTYDRADTPQLAYKGGEGIGKFQSQLADFNRPLAETIKGFHNIRWRFGQWDECLARDAAGRRASVAREIEWIESRRGEMSSFWALVENGTIPMRVTHNDTKISNILFDAAGNVMCVIDLDTVMSSTSLNDFGDAIRSYANTGAEDDRNPDNVSLDMEMYRAYTEGYLSQRRSTLVGSELEHLAFSARYITYEQVLRFLMDYIDGDVYYKVNAPDHNLVRTRAQYRLLQSMEEHYDEMCGVVAE
ncbi:MAG TPA: aminoglycoside phosphotransferase family protein [Candidatus Alistipes excrementipullorum]|nr:aminoglycoside phosphotransferase family protein [Candidatus Alistipes excrementipullorum]